MSKKFKHIVFTRQALYWGRVPMSDDVIDYKLDLFELTLLKSIQHQTDQDFTFVQLVSDAVPERIKERVKQYGEIIWVTEEGEHGPDAEALRRYLSKELTDEELVITTNIDSDDLPAITYVADINRLALESENFPLLFCPKHEYYFSRLGIFREEEIPETSVAPMLSVAEYATIVKTARFVNHDHMLEHFTNFQQIIGPALYTVSEANIWREYGRNGKSIFPNIDLSIFGLNKSDVGSLLSFLSKGISDADFCKRRKTYRGES
jgi:hypothetical protein